MQVLKNQDPSIVGLLDEASLQNLFVKSENTRCAIPTFEILKADGTTLDPTDSLYSLLDVANRGTNDIKIDSTVAMTDGMVVSIDYPFKVRAVAEGGTSIEKEINAKIIVCGWEHISLVSSSAIEHTLIVRDNVTETIDLTTGIFISNDTFCPINSYAIKTSDDTPALAATPSAV